MRPDRTIQKALISTTSRLVGEYETEEILITHAWPNYNRSSSNARTHEGPASRNAFVVVFRTPKIELEQLSPLPNYSGIPDAISWYLSVLFGKRFDNHGLIESIGFHNLPDLASYDALCTNTIPHNSHAARSDYAIPLNLTELSRIAPLFNDQGDSQTLRIVQTASKFYAQALQAFEHDSEVAYLHLVTALEAISTLSDLKIEQLWEPATRQYMDYIESLVPDGAKIAKHFRSKLLSIKKRVVETVLGLVDDEFFSRGESLIDAGKLSSINFRKRIGAAYDLRSKYVHTGAPFGRWIDKTFGGQNIEIQIGAPVVSDRDYGRILANAPTFVGLERVTRYCILKILSDRGLYNENTQAA